MPDWIRKPNTLASAHPLTATLTDLNGPVGLPSGSIVTIRAKVPGTSTLKINAAATVVKYDAAVGDPDRGKVRYQLQTADVDTPGIYDVDFLAEITGVGEQVFPEDGYLTLLVLEGANTT